MLDIQQHFCKFVHVSNLLLRPPFKMLCIFHAVTDLMPGLYCQVKLELSETIY